MNILLAVLFSPSIVAGVSILALSMRPLFTDKTNL